VKTGVVIFGVVGNHYDATSGSDADASQTPHEFEKGRRVEPVGLSAKPELPVPQAHGAEVSYAAPGGVMQQNGIFGFRWHPHQTPRPVLLEMDFVGGPQIDSIVLLQRLKFFLCAFCSSGSA